MKACNKRDEYISGCGASYFAAMTFVLNQGISLKHKEIVEQ